MLLGRKTTTNIPSYTQISRPASLSGLACSSSYNSLRMTHSHISTQLVLTQTHSASTSNQIKHHSALRWNQIKHHSASRSNHKRHSASTWSQPAGYICRHGFNMERETLEIICLEQIANNPVVMGWVLTNYQPRKCKFYCNNPIQINNTQYASLTGAPTPRTHWSLLLLSNY